MSEPLRELYRSKNVSFKHAVGEIDIFDKMFHECYELFWLQQGDVEFISSRIRRRVYPGQLVVIPPGEYQFVVHSDKRAYERCVIEVWPDFEEDALLFGALKKIDVLSLTPDHRIVAHFLYLTACLSRCPEQDRQYLLPAVVTDILFLIKNLSVRGALSPGQLSPLSVQLMNTIDAHYTEPLTLEELAAGCFHSVSLICHTFKKDFGISIKKYILQKRMIGARQALREGKSGKEVCLAFGFTEYSTFFRAYRQYFGYAPSATKEK